MFKIITDTACDFLMDYAASVDVTLIPLYITFDGETYYKDRTELSTDEFYRRITEEKIYPRTSLPSFPWRSRRRRRFQLLQYAFLLL